MHNGGWADALDTRDTVKAGQGYIARGECSCSCTIFIWYAYKHAKCRGMPPPSPFPPFFPNSESQVVPEIAYTV